MRPSLPSFEAAQARMGDGTITVSDPTLLDNLVNLTAKLATGSSPVQQSVPPGQARASCSGTESGVFEILSDDPMSDTGEETAPDDAAGLSLQAAHRATPKRRQSSSRSRAKSAASDVSGSRGPSPSSVRNKFEKLAMATPTKVVKEEVAPQLSPVGEGEELA